MDKKTIGIAIAVIVVVVALFLVFGKTGTPGNSGTNTEGQKVTDQGVVTPEGVVAASGASPIATSGEVLNLKGEVAKLDVDPGSPEAPQQSNPVSANSVPKAATKMTVSMGSGFSPKEFTVNSGDAVTISVSSTDDKTYVFAFEDQALSAVAVGVGPGETRLITFNAPKRGEYVFYSNVPGHKAAGLVGKMIVK